LGLAVGGPEGAPPGVRLAAEGLGAAPGLMVGAWVAGVGVVTGVGAGAGAGVGASMVSGVGAVVGSAP
jgi:hypothetical protein